MNKFKVGDRIMCIDSTDATDLTLNKEYKVFEIDKTCLQINDDSGENYWFLKERFKLVEEPQKKFIKYADRCRSPHAGSSTCANCDPAFWLDDEPYNKEKQTTHNGESEKMAHMFKVGDFVTISNNNHVVLDGLVKDPDSGDWQIDYISGFYSIRIKNIKNRMECWTEGDSLTVYKVEQKEFDATRLGYYKNRRKQIRHVFYKRKCHTYCMRGVDPENDSYIEGWTKNGKHHIDSDDDLDLVEYLGPELPKEPRKFEFETVTDKNVFNLNIKVMGDEFHPYSEYGGEKYTTKWKCTMTEIIE